MSDSLIEKLISISENNLNVNNKTLNINQDIEELINKNNNNSGLHSTNTYLLFILICLVIVVLIWCFERIIGAYQKLGVRTHGAHVRYVEEYPLIGQVQMQR